MDDCDHKFIPLSPTQEGCYLCAEVREREVNLGEDDMDGIIALATAFMGVRRRRPHDEPASTGGEGDE